MLRLTKDSRVRLHPIALLLVGVLVFGFPASRVAGAPLPEASSAAAGTLSVVSEPAGAAVYVDGELRGETPLSLDGLAPGDHRVKLVKEGYLENSRVLSLETDRSAAVEVTLTPSAGEPRNAMQIQTTGGGGSRLPLILAIVGGGAAAAYFALRPTNDPPNPGSVVITPGITGIQSVTEFRFTASGASDPDDDPLSFTWDFGDGTSGSGETTTHIYQSAANFTVTLTVSDGEESATATGSANVGSLTGTWRGGWENIGRRCADGRFFFGPSQYIITLGITQSALTLGGSYADPCGSTRLFQLPNGRLVAGTRRVVFNGFPNGTFEVSDDVQEIQGCRTPTSDRCITLRLQ